MSQIHFERDGDIFTLDGREYMLGHASGIDNNCLIDTLRQKLSIIANVSSVRRRLQERFPSGEATVTANNFREHQAHWRAVLEFLGEATGHPIDTNQYCVVCLDLTIGHSGDVVGTGALTLHIARVGLNHFVPLIRRCR